MLLNFTSTTILVILKYLENQGFCWTEKSTISQTRIPLFFLREGLSLGAKTYTPLWKFVAWSLRFLLEGQCPNHDYNGKPRQGKKLDQTFVVTEFRSDWKYVVDLFALSSNYNASNTCHRCECTKQHGPLGFGQFGMDAAWVGTQRSNTEFLRKCLPNLDSPLLNPLVLLPDFHMSQIKACFMHVAHLGIGLYTNGSAINVLMLKGFLGEDGTDEQLQRLWSMFKIWRKANKVSVSIPKFRAFCLHETDNQAWYHTKAWHGRVLTAFLASVLCEKSREQPGDNDLAMAANCLFHLGELYNSLEEAPRYVSRDVSRNGLSMLYAFVSRPLFFNVNMGLPKTFEIVLEQGVRVRVQIMASYNREQLLFHLVSIVPWRRQPRFARMA